MIKTRNFIITLCIMVMAFAFLFPSFAVANAENRASFEEISISNGDFNSSPNSSTLDSDPTGWSLIRTSSTARAGIINVNDTRFKSNYSSYYLNADENPRTMNTNYDDKVLMINARTSSTGSEVPAIQGYRSDEITLQPYSYYTFSILARTMNNAKASIYLTGLDEEVTNVSFESFEADVWTEYEFFIATGTSEETVSLELYLGRKENTTSSGVVFFDNVVVQRHTNENYMRNLNNAQSSDTVENYVFSETSIDINYVENVNSELTYADSNLNFEKGTLEGWTIANNEFPANAVADVFNVNQDFSLGSDLTANNNYALMLSTETAGYFGYISPKIDVPMHAIYKISVNVKVENISGNAYILLKENNDVNEFYDKDNPSEAYTPVENEIVISANSTDTYQNNYTTCSFYVKGNALYPTSFNLELWLGQSDDASRGTVVFDTIRIETISAEDFTSATESTSTVKVTLSSISEDPTFTNGTFNTLNNQSATLEYPIHASDWTVDVADEDATAWGVINTNTTLYESIKNEFLGGRANPENPKVLGNTIPITDTNNILMMWNKGETYQSLVSPSFSASADTYYSLKFSYKTVSNMLDNDNILNVYVIDDNGTVLFEELGLNSSNIADKDWSSYEIIIRTAQATKSLNIELELGTETDGISGVAYFDNFELNTVEYTDEEYENLIETANIVDFTNAGFNLISSSMNTNGVYDALTYTGTLEEGTNPSAGDDVAFGGIIDSEDNNFGLSPNPDNTSIIKNVMLIKTNGISKYSMKSNDTISLTEGSYYKFTVYIKTNVKEHTGNKEQAHGAEFSLEGIDGAKIDNIISNDFTAYNIYISALQDTDVNLRFALAADKVENTGYAFFDSFSYETVEEAVYNAAKDNKLANSIFVETASAEEGEEGEQKPGDNNVIIWYVIPSVIFALAIILALIAYAMKRVKIKKPESKKKGNYDREQTMYRDVVRKEAEDRRNERLKALKADLKAVQEEIDTLENENKERIASQRKEHGKQITKEDEKAFKLYANKHTKLLNKLDAIKAEIENVSSPEYIIKEIKKIKQGK